MAEEQKPIEGHEEVPIPVTQPAVEPNAALSVETTATTGAAIEAPTATAAAETTAAPTAEMKNGEDTVATEEPARENKEGNKLGDRDEDYKEDEEEAGTTADDELE